jgi:alpha-N-acetylglucosaminidase
MVEILNDMEELLASDDHFLLSNWLESSKLKANIPEERNTYEWNARAQITLWGFNSSTNVT